MHAVFGKVMLQAKSGRVPQRWKVRLETKPCGEWARPNSTMGYKCMSFLLEFSLEKQRKRDKEPF